MTPEPDPHPASARVRIGSTTYVSSVLPWRGCGPLPPWVGDRHVDKTESAVRELVTNLRDAPSLVWGGDWNHALTSKEYAGSIGGRRPFSMHSSPSALRRRPRTCPTQSTVS